MRSLVTVFLLFCSYSASACPFCDSKTATEIRASLFGLDFFYNLAASTLPFVAFYAILLVIYKSGGRQSVPRN